MNKHKAKLEALQRVIGSSVDNCTNLADVFCKQCVHSDKDGYTLDYNKYCKSCSFEFRYEDER